VQSDRDATPLVTAPGRRSASWAAVMSFLWPGLGQLYRGRRRTALVYALPPALVAGAVVAAVAGGLERLAISLFTPQVALGVVGIAAVLGVWRVIAIFDARRRAAHQPPDSTSRRSLIVASLLSLVVVGTHGFAGYYAYSFYRAGEQIFQPLPSAQPTLAPTPVEGAPPTATAPIIGGSPVPTDSPVSGLINVLFVGIDRGLMDNTNTDTILLASLDPRTDRIVMISLPRDTAQVPLYSGGTWDGKVNALYHYAEANPDEFPDGGMGTLVREMEFLVGVPIDYYASVEMAGFWEVIDLVGGVEVVLERAIADPIYSYLPERRGFYLEAGPHHLDGRTALAYVRSRYGPGNSDYVRARRQQQVLLALRQRLRDPAVLLNMPSLLDAAGQMVRTDVPFERVSEFIGLLQASGDADTRNVVLGPRRYAERVPPAEIGGQFATRLKMDEVAALSVRLFGEESRYAGLSPAPSVTPGASPTAPP